MPLKIFVSKITDGSMKSISDGDRQQVYDARNNFILKNNINPSDTTLVRLDYASDNFKRYYTIDESFRGDGIVRNSTFVSDAITVADVNHALFLPLADCIGAVIYDPRKNIMMMSHLGRHSLEQFGALSSVDYLVGNFSVNPADLQVWLSPAAGQEAYPLLSFDNQSLHQVAINQLIKAGILVENINASMIDSAADKEYYSHSQFLKGNRASDGRFAILAVFTR